jgi:hypothetical protein
MRFTLALNLFHSERDDCAANLQGISVELLQREGVLEEDQRSKLRTIILNVDAIRLIFDDSVAS